MSQTQAIRAPATLSRYPKRKRADINYYVEDDAQVDEDIQEEQCSQPKKRKSTATKPLPKRKVFPFLELPAEIRNVIYSHCFTDPSGVYLMSTTKKYRRTVYRVPEDTLRPNLNWNNPYNSDNDGDSSDSENDEKEKEKEKEKSATELRPFVPALLAVCKQINQEGRDLLYGNDFHVEDTLAMHSFLVDIGPRAASLLKNMTLIRWGEGRGVHKAYNHAGFTALSAATNLQKFKMHGYTCYGSSAKSVATQFYRDAFPWLEAVGSAKGKLNAAVDVIEITCDSFSGRRRWYSSWRNQESPSDYKDMEGVRAELTKLLNGRMKMIKS